MSSRTTVGKVKRLIAIFVAVVVVLAAGIVVGQAPAIFGVEEDPTASITFDDQRGNATAVTIEELSLSDGGFVVLTDGGGEIIAVSSYYGAGTYKNVSVERDDDTDRELLGQLTATVHKDTTEDQEFAFEASDGEEDRPYIDGGYPVSDTATVTMADRDGEEPSDSFVVESIDAPATATTTDSITVSGDIRNPTASEQRQHVEFRLDGDVLERQVLDLEADETREVTFDINVSGFDSGTYALGIYTTDSGVTETIDLEYGGPATLDVRESTESTVTVDVALPEDGFVAVENDTGSVVGVSEPLERGEYENVTVTYELAGNETATASNETNETTETSETNETATNLTAVLYEGDPAEYEDDDFETATAFEVDGERVTAPIVPPAPETDDETGD